MNRREMLRASVLGTAGVVAAAAGAAQAGADKRGSLTIRVKTPLGNAVVDIAAVRDGQLVSIADELVEWANVPRGLWKKSLSSTVRRDRLAVRFMVPDSRDELSPEVIKEFESYCLAHGCSRMGEYIVGPA